MHGKQKRIISIPEEPLPLDTYEDLLQHAIHSSRWYIERFPCHSSKIRQRLQEKGYPDHPVDCVVENPETTQQIDFIEETIQILEKASLLDDRHYLIQKISSLLQSGVGERKVQQKLVQQGVPYEEIMEVLENDIHIEEEVLLRSVSQAVAKIRRSSTYQKKDEWQQKIFLQQKLFMQGFDSDIINTFFECYEEEYNE